MSCRSVFIILLFTLISLLPSQSRRTLTVETLRDKIAGGWAGKMIGVTYGAPVEFKALGTTFEDSIRWTPADIPGSMWQDDIYVQLTFMMTMDRYGKNADPKIFQEMFAKAGYMLWHANVQSRKNYYDSIFPSLSGQPQYNAHADDIDFQIEADYLGFMHPGMPRSASEQAMRIGHIMNYGNGVYGGVFLAALHAHAFFSDDVQEVVASALRSLPPQSDYAKIVSDVITLHRRFPNDWRSAWKELQAKWGNDHICEAGSAFNIDATLNGAYIVMGLLYGNGDIDRTLEVSARCGQDADCNPSSAIAVLGVMKGFSGLPRAMQEGVMKVRDSLFINTDYSFRTAVERTVGYARATIAEHGGSVSDSLLTIITESPEAVPFEESFPNVVVQRTVPVFSPKEWERKGKWDTLMQKDWRTQQPVPQSLQSDHNGAALTFTFRGTGVAICGNWHRAGGRADIALDGKLVRTVDTYFYYNGQEHDNMVLWQTTGLKDQRHAVTVTVRGEHRADARGSVVNITRAIVFDTKPKQSERYIFPWEK